MASKPRGLGRGLESLIPAAPVSATPVSPAPVSATPAAPAVAPQPVSAPILKKETDQLEIRAITASRFQPRKFFPDQALQELAESIKEQGVIQPLIVCQAASGKAGEYELIAGERRLRAAQLAGLKTVPVVVKEVTDKQHMQMALVENIQRQDLNPIEEAMAYKRLMEEFDLTQEELSPKIGKSRATIANTLRLLQLPSALQEALASGSLSAGHARNLVGLEDENTQKQLVEKILKENLTVRDIERIVSELKIQSKRYTTPYFDKSYAPKDASVREAENLLQQYLGTKVNISVRGKGKNLRGAIKIDYLSLDDFDRLVSLIKK